MWRSLNLNNKIKTLYKQYYITYEACKNHYVFDKSFYYNKFSQHEVITLKYNFLKQMQNERQNKNFI